MKPYKAITVAILAMSSNVFAGSAKDLLAIAAEDAPLAAHSANFSQMTPSALAEYQKVRNYARQVEQNSYDNLLRANPNRDYSEVLEISKSSHAGLNQERNFAVVAPKVMDDGSNGAVLQQMELAKNGTLFRSGMNLPPTQEKPTSVTVKVPSWGYSRTGEVDVNRTFNLPNGQEVKLRNTMSAQTIFDRKTYTSDGKTYATVLATSIKSGDTSAWVSIDPRDAVKPGEIHLYLSEGKESSSNYVRASGTFNVPKDIGEVVAVNVDLHGTHFSFKTTDGFEYTYSIKKTPSDDAHSKGLSFTLVSKTKIPGGVESLLASVKTFPARASATKPVGGMQVDLSKGTR